MAETAMSAAEQRARPSTAQSRLRLVDRSVAGSVELELVELMRHNSGGLADKSLIPVLVFIMHWDVVARTIVREKRDPTDPFSRMPVSLTLVQEYWGESERTAYRQQSRFRALFVNEHDPTRVLAYCRAWDRALGWKGLAESKVHAIA